MRFFCFNCCMLNDIDTCFSPEFSLSFELDIDDDNISVTLRDLFAG